MATYWENSCSFGLRVFAWYKYLIVNLVFPHLGFWSGNLFLIAPFPDRCLLVPFFGFKNSKFFFKDLMVAHWSWLFFIMSCTFVQIVPL